MTCLSCHVSYAPYELINRRCHKCTANALALFKLRLVERSLLKDVLLMEHRARKSKKDSDSLRIGMSGRYAGALRAFRSIRRIL